MTKRWSHGFWSIIALLGLLASAAPAAAQEATPALPADAALVPRNSPPGRLQSRCWKAGKGRIAAHTLTSDAPSW